MRISAVLIVKNEEVLLSRCLDSLKGVDEIVIVDTGSKDTTKEVAKKYTDKVFFREWDDSFCKARNFAKSHATGDWIISIDADEYLESFDNLKKAVLMAEERKVKAVNVRMVSEAGGQFFMFPRLFKNLPEVFWRGNIHNHLSVLGETIGDVKITHSFSPAHVLDPNRAFRILKKDVEKNGGPREMFYLGREYYYRNHFKECVSTMSKYVELSSFMPEKADAFLIMAKALWELKEGEKARESCMKAIMINANFKEAILFMARLSGEGTGTHKWEENARQWKRMAASATNADVLFVRETL